MPFQNFKSGAVSAGNGEVISSHNIPGIELRIHAGLKSIHMNKLCPACHMFSMSRYRLEINLCHSACDGWVAHLIAQRIKLAHWGRVTHICVGNLAVMGSVNGLSSGRRQAIVCTNAAILLILPLATNFTKLFSNFKYFYQRKCIWKCRPEKNVGHFVAAPMC